MQEMRGSRSVAAAELVRNFAHWREVGTQEPVLVTHHGRETHVFLGVERFNHMALSDAAGAVDRTRELASRMHQGIILCHADLVISFANNVALSMTRSWDRQLEGSLLWDVLPELAEALTAAHIRHSLATGESGAADIPSPFRADSWIHFETFPFAGGVGLLLRDVTADVQRHRPADATTMLVKAMSLLPGIGHVRLSTRGFIEMADSNFCDLIGLPEERLKSVSLSDIVELPARPHLREQLEAVLRGDGDRRIATRLLTNDGTVLTVEAGLVQLLGTYGTEGAVMVVTAAAPLN
ncbi:MAG: PAS domain-containing protein [Sphingobium sp.]